MLLIFQKLVRLNGSYPLILTSLIFTTLYYISHNSRSITWHKKENTSKGDDGIPAFVIKDCGFVFAETLSKIFNLSLNTGVFPCKWKKAKITPVYKNGSTTDIQNYRPIAILSTFAKIFETVLCDLFTRHCHPYISEFQHGFMPKRSTITNLMTISHDIADCLDSSGQMYMIYFDFTKAFDTIDHSLLIDKLNKFGFSDPLLKLIECYLTNRLHYVSFNGFNSFEFTLNAGVPQGSNLRPFLFLVFINDLLSSINSPVLAYADDIKLYNAINTERDIQVLQSNINFVTHWCETNKLQLNVNKCYHVSYTRMINKINWNYLIDGILVNSTNSVKDLGVLFDDHLSFRDHIY